jgi:hypothetical protein
MKVLFVGNAQGFLTIQLAKKLQLTYPELTIDILTDLSPENRHPYREVYTYRTGKGIWKRNYFKSLYQFFAMRKALTDIPEGYDAVHILLVVPTYRLFWKQLSSKGEKSILTFFGSEYYRSNFLYRIFTKGMARTAQWVTASNVQTLKDVCDHYEVAASKRRLCRFGLSILEEIDLVTVQDLASFNSQFGISEATRCISVGYNAAPIQNHPLIIEQIAACKNVLPSFVLFFQFHGHRNAYLQQLIDACESNELPYRIVDQLNDHELAVYRKRIDVCIQLQKTDQFSGAMQEHLYSGSRVITGSWLPYQVLDEKDTDYCKISSIDDLQRVLPQQIEMNSDKMKNSEIIRSLSSWEINIGSWFSLYERT